MLMVGVVAVGLALLGACAGSGSGPPNEAGRKRLVAGTTVSPDASVVSNEAELPGFERHLYVIPAGVDPRTLVTGVPGGFSVFFDAAPGDERVTAEGVRLLRTYEGTNPAQQGVGCAISVNVVTQPSKFPEMPEVRDGQQVMVVDFSC